MGLRRTELVLGSTVKRSMFSPSGQGGSSPNLKSSLLTGVGAYYAFSAGAFLVDQGSANTLTNSNGTTQGTSGLIGDCATFSAASSQSLTAPDSPSLDFTTKLSISMWINPTSNASPQAWISKGTLNTNLEWMVLVVPGTGTFFYLGSISTAISAKMNFPTPGVWNQIAVVYNGNLTGNTARVQMWLNGASQSPSFTGTFPAANTPAAGTLVLGGVTGASQFADGSEDEVFLANATWSPAQVNYLYRGGAGITYPFKGVP